MLLVVDVNIVVSALIKRGNCFEVFEVNELNLKDAPYLALVLKYNCGIFSGDKGLKEQTKIEVFSPRRLLDTLGIE